MKTVLRNLITTSNEQLVNYIFKNLFVQMFFQDKIINLEDKVGVLTSLIANKDMCEGMFNILSHFDFYNNKIKIIDSLYKYHTESMFFEELYINNRKLFKIFIEKEYNLELKYLVNSNDIFTLNYLITEDKLNQTTLLDLLTYSINSNNHEFIQILLNYLDTDEIKKFEINKLSSNVTLQTIKKIEKYIPFSNNKKTIDFFMKNRLEDSVSEYALKTIKFSSDIKTDCLIHLLKFVNYDSFKKNIDLLCNEPDIDFISVFKEILKFSINNKQYYRQIENYLLKFSEKVNKYELIYLIIKEDITDAFIITLLKELLSKCEVSFEIFRHLHNKNNSFFNILKSYFNYYDHFYSLTEFKEKFFKYNLKNCLYLALQEIERRNKIKKQYLSIYGIKERRPKIGDKLVLFNNHKKRTLIKINEENINNFINQFQTIISLEHPNFENIFIENLEVTINDKLPNELDSDISNIDDKIIFCQNYFIELVDEIIKFNQSLFNENYYVDCHIGDIIRKIRSDFENKKEIIQNYLLKLEKEKKNLEEKYDFNIL